jgi:hypothetical protein
MDPQRTYISPPVIAALERKVRTTALRRMLAGYYGPVTRRGRRNTPYVTLGAVENFHGTPFTESQVVAAIAGQPGRALIVPESEDAP